MRRFLLIICPLLAIGAAVAYYYYRGNRNKDTPDESNIELVVAEKGDLDLQVECTGRVEANREVEIKSKASGEVVELPFDISDFVFQEDLLVKLDPVDEERRVKQRRVALASSKASLHSAEAQARETRAKFERVKKLYEKELTSAEDLEIAETDYIRADAAREMAAAQVTGDELNLADAEQRLTETEIYSPIDGTITGRFIQTGQIVSSGISNVGGGTPLLQVGDLSRIFIRASVAESDIGRVELGQQAMITADAYAEEGFFGEVVRIAAKGEEITDVVIFDVMIEALGDNRDSLKPGMTANVFILAARREDIVLAPLEAVMRGREGQILTIREPDGTDVERPVVTGINNGYLVEIAQGVDAGETIVLDREKAQSRFRRGFDSGRRMQFMMRSSTGFGGSRGGRSGGGRSR